ncbi:LysR family transcriptional regulator [Streptomyces actinomycinicus]|uniref:LysR family transcriptional regulator n=1 Tax=Streptomyces actinomycinicus TaxID=1695166 RepID=A0A937JKG4_9ACTN|nr:LysR family transcriptional regulator [Streptomyces actinomycinicus]MBL1082494.1 LysR family transcriptional regulator [Streptomyces actinomycinicus]
MLDVRRLRILQYLATYGTVAAAAEALHLTAPAVSQQLAVLEREAGLPVVERHGRTLRLTAAGELLVVHAEVVLGDLAAAESDLAALRGGRRGQVRVAAFASAARTLLPAVYRALGPAREDPAPPLTIHLAVLEPEEALEALRKREADAAVVHGYTVLPRNFPSGSEQEVLMEDPVVAVLHPGRAERLGLAPGKPADLADLARDPWLTPGPETSCYEMIQRTCGAAGFVPDIRVRSSDFAVLTALVAAGAGVALAPRLAVPEGSDGVSLHPLVVPVSRTVFTVSRSGTARRPDIHHLTSLLRDAAEGWTAGPP